MKQVESRRMHELKQMHKDAGGHFFDKSAMRGFRSIVYDNVHASEEGWYFVTSEQFEGSRGDRDSRLYNVRIMYADNHRYIRTVNGFGKLSTKKKALEAMRGLASGELKAEPFSWEVS